MDTSEVMKLVRTLERFRSLPLFHPFYLSRIVWRRWVDRWSLAAPYGSFFNPCRDASKWQAVHPRFLLHSNAWINCGCNLPSGLYYAQRNQLRITKKNWLTGTNLTCWYFDHLRLWIKLTFLKKQTNWKHYIFRGSILGLYVAMVCCHRFTSKRSWT